MIVSIIPIPFQYETGITIDTSVMVDSTQFKETVCLGRSVEINYPVYKYKVIDVYYNVTYEHMLISLREINLEDVRSLDRCFALYSKEYRQTENKITSIVHRYTAGYEVLQLWLEDGDLYDDSDRAIFLPTLETMTFKNTLGDTESTEKSIISGGWDDQYALSILMLSSPDRRINIEELYRSGLTQFDNDILNKLKTDSVANIFMSDAYNRSSEALSFKMGIGIVQQSMTPCHRVDSDTVVPLEADNSCKHVFLDVINKMHESIFNELSVIYSFNDRQTRIIKSTQHFTAAETSKTNDKFLKEVFDKVFDCFKEIYTEETLKQYQLQIIKNINDEIWIIFRDKKGNEVKSYYVDFPIIDVGSHLFTEIDGIINLI